MKIFHFWIVTMFKRLVFFHMSCEMYKNITILERKHLLNSEPVKLKLQHKQGGR